MPVPIKEYLVTLIPHDHQWKVVLFQHWDIIMGPLKDKVSIAQINGDTILLKVTHPAWAQELHLLSSMLKQKINQHLGANHIKTIRFVTADTKPHNPYAKFSRLVPQYRKPYTENTVVLSSKEEALLKNITDQELKRALALFFTRCKYLKEK